MGVGGSVDQWVVERADISLLMDPEGGLWDSSLMEPERVAVMLLQETITGTFIDPPGPGFPVLGEGGKCPSFRPPPPGKRYIGVCGGLVLWGGNITCSG